MRKIAILALVPATLVAGAGSVLADHHDVGRLLPLRQLLEPGADDGSGAKATKTRPGSQASGHWGKHHHHGIQLEGGEFTSNSGAIAYD